MASFGVRNLLVRLPCISANQCTARGRELSRHISAKPRVFATRDARNKTGLAVQATKLPDVVYEFTEDESKKAEKAEKSEKEEERTECSSDESESDSSCSDSESSSSSDSDNEDGCKD